MTCRSGHTDRRAPALLAAALVAVTALFAGLYVSAVLLLWGLAGSVVAFYWIRRSPRILVWPRHGYDEHAGPPILKASLADAATGLVTPLTLHDESFPTARGVKMLRLLFSLPALVVVTSVVAYLTGAASLLALFGAGDPPADVTRSIVYWGQVIAILVVGLLLLRSLLHRRAAVEADKGEAHRVANTMLRKIREGHGPIFGDWVIHSSSRTWDAVMTEALDKADVALINVSRLDEATRRDMERVYRELGPQRVVLACAVPSTMLEAEDQEALGLPAEKRDEIEAFLGSGILESSQQLVYREREPQAPPATTLVHHRLARVMRERIAAALEAH